jgi:uncharacterized iron-regulated membrane protein
MASSNRRIWFLVHGWLSLPVWLLFSVICVTGTIAVLSHEITWLANPAARAANPDNLAARPLPELVAAVRRAVPDADIGRIFMMEPYLVTAVSLSAPDLPNALAYVNPYTAEVQAVEQGISFIGFMRSLHGWLLFPWQHSYSIGYYLVSAMSLVTLGAMVTGLVVYKRFWRGYTRPRLRFRRDARTWLGDLHRLGGIWSLWFLLVIGLTGFWYLVQAVLWHSGVDVWTHPDPVTHSDVPLTAGERPDMIGLAQALAVAQQAMPEIRPSMVSIPEHNRDYFTVAGAGDSVLFDQYSWRVFINPWTGAVADTRSPAMMNPLQTLTHIADPLHYGTLGGLWTKVIWFLFGLVLSGMSISGFLIYGKRTAKAVKVRSKAPPRATTPVSAPGQAEGA